MILAFSFFFAVSISFSSSTLQVIASFADDLHVTFPLELVLKFMLVATFSGILILLSTINFGLILFILILVHELDA